ncbi:hypothetical protein K456DRAFT_53129 [Colletotrichum gloeosporioides 23]|nr:hypothetical protein K456DRAFT_53129 [Colletotrichum gloeosporioides 23]
MSSRTQWDASATLLFAHGSICRRKTTTIIRSRVVGVAQSRLDSRQSPAGSAACPHLAQRR